MQVAHSGAETILRLEDHEADLLRELARETRTLLEADVPRADPVVARLFPDAYEDPEHAQTYHDLVGDELRREKLDALAAVSDSVGPSGPAAVTLTDDLITAWLAWLTDVRLAIGTRLGVTEETTEDDFDPDSPEGQAFEVFAWVAWIQEMILERIPRPS